MGKPLEDLRDALAGTGAVVPLQVEAKGGGVGGSVMCRPVPGQESVWLEAMRAMLKATAAVQGLNLHLAKRYVLGKTGEMAFGWYVGVTCTKAAVLKEAVQLLIGSLSDLSDLEPVRPAARPVRPPVRQESHTTASPRAPEYSPDPVVPRVDVRLKTLMDTTRAGPDGKPVRTSIQEIPLAHVYGELNKENAKGRGAIGGADSMPRILRNR